jgi:hypothetical protein
MPFSRRLRSDVSSMAPPFKATIAMRSPGDIRSTNRRAISRTRGVNASGTTASSMSRTMTRPLPSALASDAVSDSMGTR